MASLNKVMLIGNLTRDAQLRYIGGGGQAVLEFGLAVNRRYRTQSGEQREETAFVDISLWGKRAVALEKYMTKGTTLYVEGRLRFDKWQDKATGQARSKLCVVAENVEFLGGGRKQGQDGADSEAQGNSYGNEQAYNRSPSAAPQYPVAAGAGGGMGLPPISDAEVPF